MTGKRRPLEERFWDKVDKKDSNECWLWTGAQAASGYGTIGNSGKMIGARRYSYELAFGCIPKGMFVCQKCHKSLCVNPNHLFLSTFKNDTPDYSNKEKIMESIMKRIEKDENGCWLWQRSKTEAGYAVFGHNNKNFYVHRWIVEYYGTVIPEGLEVDHLCKVRHCVNPKHLEVVTPEENRKRSSSIIAKNSEKTHCPKGHEYNEENTHFYSNGHRRCKECNRQKSKAWKRRKKEEKSHVV